MADQYPQLPGTQIVDPWDSAFGAYRQALVDLNGDGVPDAITSPSGQVQPLDNRMRQSISRQAMAGREPTVDMGGIGRRAQASEQNSQAFEQGMGELVMGQPVRAYNALSSAYNDPSLATITNAGVQTALTVPTARGAMTAAKIGGAGLGAAAAQDFGGLFSIAEAGQGDRDKARAAREQAGAARANADAERARAEASRSMSEQRLKEQRETLANAENDAAVKRAVMARDTILSDRPKKFSETRTGQVFDELGMVAPAIPAALAGGLAGAGIRAAGAGHKAVTATGLGVGGLAGGLAGNWPLAHELMVAKPFNPEKEAYKAGAREMPSTDPRKAEWQSYAENQPDENPARTVALNELLNLPMTAKRSIFPAAEGALAGWAAVDLPGVVNRLMNRGRGTGPGNTGGQPTGPGGQGPGGAPTSPQTSYRTYPELPSDIKDGVRSRYVSQRALTGESLPVGKTAQTVKNDIAQHYNASVPVTSARVSETNKVIDAFVQQYGRLPTKAEFAHVFTSKTLALPMAGGAAAGPVNALMNRYQGQEPAY